MDFTLTDEQQAVRELAGEILRDLTTHQRLSALGDTWFHRDAWQQLAQAGLLGVALPEDDGGSGLGFLGAHLVLEQIGATAAPVPFWETIVLGALPVARFGSPAQRDQILPGVLSGDLLLTAALSDEADGRRLQTRATATADGWELTGVKATVPLAPLADFILMPAATDGGASGIWLVPAGAPRLGIEEQSVISGQPHGEVTLDRVTVSSDALLGDDGVQTPDWLLLHGAAGLSSLLSGVCGAVVRLSADYTSRREQFGRPVATFQAVAQRVADAYIDAEAVALTSLQAAWRLTEGLPAAEEVAIATWWAAEAGHRVLHAAHHVHGGVGVDREYPLHRYFGVAKQAEFLLGGATTHLLHIGAALAAEPV